MRATPPSLNHPQDVRARLLWWAPTYAVTLLGLVGGIAALITSQPAGVAVCAFAIIAVAGAGGIRERTSFRRGWRFGYESAIRTALQYQAGRTPDVEARAVVHGDPVPEPWEQHVSPVRPRSPR